MTLTKLAPALALAFTFAGSLATAEESAADAATQATPEAVAPEAVTPEATPAEQATTEPTEELTTAEATTPQADALGPVGHDAQGRAGRVHVVESGDTLWDISDAYLGTPWVWPSIWKDNTAEVENPHRIYPGERIWISPYEMRKVTAEEAAEMLARGPIEDEPMPAAMGDPEGPELAPVGQTYHFSEIETTGFVTLEELEGAASILDAMTPRTMYSQELAVQIGLGRGEVAVGDELEVFRPGDMVIDPSTRRKLGRVTEQLGWLEVTEVHDESATGVIRLSRADIARGDHVMPRRHRNQDILVGGRVDVNGILAHTPNHRLQMGSGDVVYLNRGTRQGLTVGSPLEVFEHRGKGYDAVRKEKRDLPDQVIAKLLVVETRDDTAVAVVTYAVAELNRGYRFRGSDSIWP